MKKIFLFAFLLFSICFGKAAFAQINHVLNPSFEDILHYDSLEFAWVRYAHFWSGTDSASIVNDAILTYTYPSKYNNLPIPDVSWGGGGEYQYPRTGNTAIDMVIYDDSSQERRYALGRLDGKLIAGHMYCLTLYANLDLPIMEGIASNRICAYVGDSTLDTIQNSRGNAIHYFTPQLQGNAIISDSQNWVKEEVSFIANGNENRIIIGNFYYDYQTTILWVNVNGVKASDYFIDDISVVETNAKIRAGNDTTINEDDTVILGKGITEGLPCDWFTASGTPVYSGSTPTIKPTKTTTYVVKMDLCGSISTDTMTVFVIPTGMEQLTNNAHLLIYPNPCKNNLKISQFENLKMFEVFDLLGSLKLTPAAIPPSKGARGMFEIEVSNLPAGIYFLKATDDKGFQRTTKFVKE